MLLDYIKYELLNNLIFQKIFYKNQNKSFNIFMYVRQGNCFVLFALLKMC